MFDSSSTTLQAWFIAPTTVFSIIADPEKPHGRIRDQAAKSEEKKKKGFCLLRCAHNNLITLSRRKCINDKFLVGQLWNYESVGKSKERIRVFSH